MPFQKQVVAAEVMVMPRSLLLLHPVHGGGAIVHFTNLVRSHRYSNRMRSVVVVLPASMCAEIPIFRYRSMGVLRATWGTSFFKDQAGRLGRPADRNHVKTSVRFNVGKSRQPSKQKSASLDRRRFFAAGWLIASEAEVSECLVGLRHAVHFIALLDRAATAFGGFHQLVGQTLRPSTSRCACARLRFSQRMARAMRRIGAHFDRHLVVCTTDAAGLDLDHRLGTLFSAWP